MIDICDLAVGQSRQLFGKTLPSERPGHRLAETWHPLGVVGVISAFNFPVAVYAWNTALALVAGDTVVWKPAEATNLSAIGGRRAARPRRAGGRCARGHSPAGPRRPRGGAASGGRPAGGAGVGDRFGADGPRDRAAIAARGSAGRCSNWAATTPRSWRLSADLDLALRGIVFAAAGTAGQRCTTLRRLIVHSSVADQLVQRIVDAYRTLTIGDPRAEGTWSGR